MASVSSSGRSASSATSTLGYRAEQQVGQWLADAGWQLLHHRWHCRWGELDWIALSPQQADRSHAKGEDGGGDGHFANVKQTQNQLLQELVFFEVKARRRGNWDADGLLAITPQKQAKLWQTAELFLSEHPHLAAFPCRFDVVLVRIIGKGVGEGKGEQLIVQQHICNAFSL